MSRGVNLAIHPLLSSARLQHLALSLCQVKLMEGPGPRTRELVLVIVLREQNQVGVKDSVSLLPALDSCVSWAQAKVI